MEHKQFMNFIFGEGVKCDNDFAFRIFAQIQNLAAWHGNSLRIERNAKSQL
jgi:hypothetical protein